MRTRLLFGVCLSMGMLASACGPSLAQRETAAQPAIEALRQARFDEAARKAAEVATTDRENPFAHLVAAVSRFRTTMHQLVTDLPSALLGAAVARGFNHRYMRFAFEQAEKELRLVDADLEVAARFPELTFDLCLACWRVDWNRNGEVDSRDERLFQIEVDANGKEIPESDPRRKPTFRFDHGDVLWARAFVQFQRAALNVFLAYDWSAIDGIIPALMSNKKPVLTIKLEKRPRIEEAKRLILAGLDLADQARRAYLAETDDEREWLPNPRQKNHPLPLPVDDALYQTWEQILGDLRRIVEGEEGVSVAELAQLGDHKWKNPPKGFLDFGGMLSRPKDIVIDLGLGGKDADELETRPEPILKEALGEYYAASMKPSPIISRLSRMKREVERGQESFERKLRYLLWLN
jgi:hypothetical protein